MQAMKSQTYQAVSWPRSSLCILLCAGAEGYRVGCRCDRLATVHPKFQGQSDHGERASSRPSRGKRNDLYLSTKQKSLFSVLPPSDDFVTMQVLDFPLLVKDGGASLKSDLGVCSKCYLSVAQSSIVQSRGTMQDMA